MAELYLRWMAAVIAAILMCGPAANSPLAGGASQAAALNDVVFHPSWNLSEGWRPPASLPPLKVDVSPSIKLLNPSPGCQWVEDDEQTILWQWTGPISSVRLYYYYDRCKLGGRSRGRFGALVTDMIDNRGFFTWRIPWMDAPGFWLRIAGYDASGNRLAADEVYVTLRPKEAKNIHGTFILVVRRRQRLYYFKDDQLVRMHIVSTARPGYITPPMHPGSVRRGVRMGQVFSKIKWAWSRAYNCPMPYWLAITSTGSHGIHATTPSAYRRLGRPASHGCIRQHARDAKVLFEMVEIGTPVYVF